MQGVLNGNNSIGGIRVIRGTRAGVLGVLKVS